MKPILVVLAFLAAGPAIAEAIPSPKAPVVVDPLSPPLIWNQEKPLSLPEMKLTLTMPSAQKTKVHFVPGSIYACAHTPSLMPGYIKDYFKCTLHKTGASVRFPGDDHDRHFWLKFLRAQYQFYNRRLIRRYDFEGIEQTTKVGEPVSKHVLIEVWYYDKAPGTYYGFLRLRDQGIYGTFGASPMLPVGP
jgi:hypothetical protein